MVVMLGASACAASPHPVVAPLGAGTKGGDVAWSPPWNPSGSGVVPGASSVTPAFTGALEPAPGDEDPFALVSVAYVSPSALETFELCERKWAWSKLDRIPKIMGDAASLGDGVHKQHEAWLGKGVPYDLTRRVGQLAMATMHLLPAPGVARIEQEVTYDWRASTGTVIRLGGKIDANWFDDEWTRPVVLDHKTTGSIGFRKDTKAKLLGHPQAPIYATWAIEFSSPAPWTSTELRWNYVDTKPKRPLAYPSWHVVQRDEAALAMTSVVEPIALRLVARVEQANAERSAGRPFAARHLPMNTNACSAFGGCQFRSRCQLTPSQEFNAHMSQQTTSFLARLNITPGGAVPAPAAPPAPPVQTSPIPAVAQASAATVEGYGGAINPPESTAPAAAPPVASPQAPPPAPPVVVNNAPPVAGPGRGRGKKADAPAVVAPETPPTPSNPFGSLLAAAVQGLCANPALAFVPADQLVTRAAEIAKGLGQ